MGRDDEQHSVMDRIRDAITAQRVFGEAYELDGLTVIPVAKVAGGGGGGEGERSGDEGSGGGLGLAVNPVGAYVVRDGTVEWQPAIDVTRLAAGGLFVGVVALWTVRALIREVGRDRRSTAEKKGSRRGLR